MKLFGSKNIKSNDKDKAKIKMVEVSMLHFDRDFKNVFQLDKKTLVRLLGEAVMDRLSEVATSIEFSGESYRINKRKIA